MNDSTLSTNQVSNDIMIAYILILVGVCYGFYKCILLAANRRNAPILYGMAIL